MTTRGLLLLGLVGCGGPSSEGPPNLVLLVGPPPAPALAADGISFPSAFAVSDHPATARAALLAGRVLPETMAGPVPAEAVLAGEVLGYYGYQTGAVVGTPGWDPASGLRQGFSSVRAEATAEAVVAGVEAWLAVAREPFFLLVDLPASGDGAAADLARLLARRRDHTTLVVQGPVAGSSFADRDLAGLLVLAGTALPADQRGSTRADPASTVDVLPTLLARAGAVRPQGVTGRDLLAADPAPGPVFQSGRHSAAVRTRQWRLVQAGDEPRLYDLEADPEEQRDVAPDHPEVAADLAAMLARWKADLQPAAAAVPLPDPELEAALRTRGYW